MLSDYSEGVRYLIMTLYVFAVALNTVFFFSIYRFKLEYRINNRICAWLLSILFAITSSCIVTYLLFYAIGFIIRYIQLFL